MKIKALSLCAIVSMFFVATDVPASGTYRSNSPRPPSKERVDRDKYGLGQKVFNGKAAPAKGDPTRQKPRLAALQASLPAKVAKKKDLTALAGQISDEQLGALEYYVGQRYAN
jgi:hypothetical protein